MEYEDTNILRTQYVDDLVEQRQKLEDVLMYQDITVNPGEPFNVLIPKAESITGSKPYIPILKFAYSKISQLSLDDLNTAGWEDFSHMFYQADFSGGVIDVSDFEWSDVKTASNMFSYLDGNYAGFSIGINLGQPDWSNLESIENMFNCQATNQKYNYISNIDDIKPIKAPKLINLNMFASFRPLNATDHPMNLILKLKDVRPKTLKGLCCKSASYTDTITSLEPLITDYIAKNWDLSQLESISEMFKNINGYNDESRMKYFNDLIDNFKKWDLSNVIDASYLFNYQASSASSTISIDVDLSNVTFDKLDNASYMFSHSHFTNINAGVVPNETLTKINYLFYNSYLNKFDKTFDISRWNLGAVINTSYAFPNNTTLISLKMGYNLGKAYVTTTNNSSAYAISLSSASKLHAGDVVDMFNKIYDLNLSYNVANGGKLYTQKIDLHADVIAQLTPEEIAIATNKGWTIV